MTGRRQARQEGRPGAGEALAGLAWFRREFYGCLWQRPDALFELADAVLTAPRAGSLPYLSLEPAFRRGHGMIYQALAEGRIDEEALRDLLVAARPRDWPPVFAIDASTYPRPAAATSPDREWHHHSCQGHHGRRREPRDAAGARGRDGDAVVAGWSFQWLAQLSFTPDSWTAPQDMVRAGVRDDATRQAAEQVIEHSARLRADGEARVPLYVFDGGYDEAPLTWDLREHLDQAQILVRVRNDRVMYRDPAPEPPRRGRPRKHSIDRFECKNPATWGPPDRELSLDDGQYGHVSVSSWGGLHPRLYCRGRFAGFWPSPVIRCHLVRVTVDKLPGGRRAPGPLWLWWAGPGAPDLDLCWRAYLHRFRYRAHLPVRQARPGLGQDRPPLSPAGQPLDVAGHRGDHPAPPGPPGCRRPPAALGTPPRAGKTHPRPRPQGFPAPGRTSRHAGQITENLQARARTAQRPHQHPSHQVPRHHEGRLTTRGRLKRKARMLVVIYGSGAVGRPCPAAGQGGYPLPGGHHRSHRPLDVVFS
jgi:DDE superfamily endonuclease